MNKTLALSVAGMAFTMMPVLSEPVVVNAIATKVNGKIITTNEVNFRLAPIYAQLVALYPRRGPEFMKRFSEARDGIIKELVDRQILLDEFEAKGFSIRPNLIDEEIKRQVREIYNGNEDKLREELKSNMLTMDRFREMTREQLVVQAMRTQQYIDAPPPLPNEIQNEYNEIKVNLRDMAQDKITFRKIFIPSEDPANPQATADTQLDLAEDIAKQIKEGKDFEEMAKTYSKDAFAEQGGLQEDLPRIDLSPEFAAIIFDAPENELVGPLLDPRGYTIFKVLSKKLGPPPPLSEVRPMVEERVRRKKTSQKYERWIESLRKRAIISPPLN